MKSYFTYKVFWLASLAAFNLHAESVYNFNFTAGNQGWVADFADYPVGQEVFYELSWGWTNLPKPLPTSTKALVLAGNNHSDDLLMFVKKQIDGLEPNTEYDLAFSVTCYTNVPTMQLGIGGSPGESVYFKVGAAADEPLKIIQKNDYRLNWDIGMQGSEGEKSIIIGDLANPAVDPQNPSFMPKEMQSRQNLKAITDSQGRLWLLVGTDSAFEGYSRYYLTKVTLTVEKQTPLIPFPRNKCNLSGKDKSGSLR